MSKLEPQGSGRTWPELRSGIRRVESPKIISRQVPLESPHQKFFYVTADAGVHAKEYFVNEFGIRAGLVVERNGAILLVRQYRLLIDSLSWEIPGGGVDQGESPCQAAIRECTEETGVVCYKPKLLLFFHTGLDIVFSPAHLFYSTCVLSEAKERQGDRKEVSAWE